MRKEIDMADQDINFSSDRDIAFTPDPGTSRTAGASERGQDMGDQLQQTAQRAADQARDTIESGKATVAGRVDTMGDRMEERGREMEQEGGLKGKAGSAMTGVGEAMTDSADYLRSHDLGDMRDDLSHQIRQHPLLSMGVAIGAGFLLSRILD